MRQDKGERAAARKPCLAEGLAAETYALVASGVYVWEGFSENDVDKKAK